MTDRLEALITELGTMVGQPLHLDKSRSCMLNVNDTLHVQISEDVSQDRIIIFGFIGEVPVGRFRTDVFKEGLKANHAHPELGNLGFSGKNNELALHKYLSLVNLTGDKLASELALFIEYVDQWRTAIINGRPGPSPQTPAVGSMFGLKP